MSDRGKWNIPRMAAREGKVVFFPNIDPDKAYSILSFERKQGMRFKAQRAVYQGCSGVVAWRTQ